MVNKIWIWKSSSIGLSNETKVAVSLLHGLELSLDCIPVLVHDIGDPGEISPHLENQVLQQSDLGLLPGDHGPVASGVVRDVLQVLDFWDEISNDGVVDLGLIGVGGDILIGHRDNAAGVQDALIASCNCGLLLVIDLSCIIVVVHCGSSSFLLIILCPSC